MSETTTAPTVSMTTDSVHFPVLDTLRAVGALAVLTTHAAFWAGSYTSHGVWGTLLARLDVGVAIFFVLSGFLLSHPYLTRAAALRSPPGTGRYLWKRLIRIAPVYLITVAFALSLIRANHDIDVGGWAETLLMLNTFLSPTLPDGLTQMWSLAVEVTFYLVLPIIMLAAVGRRRNLRPGRVVAILLLMVAINIWWYTSGSNALEPVVAGAPQQWLPSYLSWFAVGIFLALVHVLHERGSWGRVTRPMVALARQPGSCWAMVVGLMLVVSTPLAGPSMLAVPSVSEALVKNLVYAAVGGLLVLSGVFAPSSSVYAKTFGAAPARHLGYISYGIFCLHLPMLHLVMWLTGWTLFQGRLPGIWLLAVVLSIAAAELVYRVVELPSMRVKNLGRPGNSEVTAATSDTSTR